MVKQEKEMKCLYYVYYYNGKTREGNEMSVLCILI